MIGRNVEQRTLGCAYDSDESEFVAVYGRRRIGKTYLVREFFKGRILFEHTGLEKGGMRLQLGAFRDSLVDAGLRGCPEIATWMEAFRQLKVLVESSRAKRKVLFIDEMPWMDTPRSNFVTALEHFWNAWMSARKDVVLIVCGSATSWIINKVIRSRGGLHNRVTKTVPLSPFSLGECEAYARSRGLRHDRKALTELYMVFGGVAYYWRQFEKGESVAQTVDRLLFAADAPLRDEYDRIFASLFRSDAVYRNIVTALATRGEGLFLSELLSLLKAAKGGRWSSRLEELEQCGFVRRDAAWGKKERESRYLLIDNFVLFSLTYLKTRRRKDEHFWLHATTSGELNSWRGLAFERVCLQHIRQIKTALGVSGVLTDEFAWRHDPDDACPQGAQIDLVMDRDDRVVNICEMKFSNRPFVITKKYAQELQVKVDVFREVEDVRKSIFLTLVSASGVADNAYADALQSVVVLDDLFREERI